MFSSDYPHPEGTRDPLGKFEDPGRHRGAGARRLLPPQLRGDDGHARQRGGDHRRRVDSKRRATLVVARPFGCQGRVAGAKLDPCAMGPPLAKFSRQTLYDLVWSKPLAGAATEVGLSANGLAKLCDRLMIPRPARTYWTRVGRASGDPRPPCRRPARDGLRNRGRRRPIRRPPRPHPPLARGSPRPVDGHGHPNRPGRGPGRGHAQAGGARGRHQRGPGAQLLLGPRGPAALAGPARTDRPGAAPPAADRARRGQPDPGDPVDAGLFPRVDRARPGAADPAARPEVREGLQRRAPAGRRSGRWSRSWIRCRRATA
jgi:hypothetical protein